MLSVIIPTKDRAQHLEQLFQALRQQTLGQLCFEVILVDNGSSDKTKDVVDKWRIQFRNFRYFCEESPGLHVGRHIGLREANGDILVYADDDVEPFKTWLESIQSSFANPEVALVGGKCLPKFESRPPLWIRRLWRPNKSGERILGYLSLIDLGDTIKLTSPYHIFGCNFAIRKDILIEAKGFHPDAFPQEFIRYRGDGETHVSRYVEARSKHALYHPGASVYHCIPTKRLTLEYFCQRSFNQGISDSFRKIRQTYLESSPTLAGPESAAKKELPLANLFRFLRKKGDKVFSEFAALKPSLTPLVNFRLRNAYRSGYDFHQESVKQKPELSVWVMHSNYLEKTIPE